MAKNMKRIHKVTVKHIPDDAPCVGMECGHNINNTPFIGICADAEVLLGHPHAPQLFQVVSSGGLWGIESDSDADYLKSVEDEQLAELRNQLHAIGFSQRAITAAFRNVERG